MIQGFIADFYCYSASLVVEVDGSSPAARVGYDPKWDQIVAALDLRVLRISNADVRQTLKTVLTLIREAARITRASEPLLPLPSEGRGKRGAFATPGRLLAHP